MIGTSICVHHLFAYFSLLALRVQRSEVIISFGLALILLQYSSSVLPID